MRNRAVSVGAALFVLLAVGLVLAMPGAPGHRSDAGQDAAQDAWKAAHAARVVAELEARDISGLTPAQRANRARNLEALLTYGRDGRFAQNEAYPGEAIPHLIDHHGTRCALANLIDKAGDVELLQRLARGNNIAFVPALQHDAELGAWLDREGLTIEEAAYIQAPGFVDPGPGRTPWANDPTTPAPTPGASSPTTTSPSMGGRRRGRSGTTVATWQGWWNLNRHAFLNLRARYNTGAVVTGDVKKAARGRRPSDSEIDATVIPLLRKLATGKDDRVRATALMAWARAARAKHAPEVIEAVTAYLGNHDNQFRELMILAYGVVRHADAAAHLRALAHDTPAGRKLFGKNGSLPDRTRAYAAIALGQSGQAEAVADLTKILDDKRTKSVDLKACAVMGLGTLAGSLDAAQRRTVTAYLVRGLRKESWSDVVLSTVPTALARAGDETLLLPTLQPILERFRKPTQVRQSSALAMAALAPKARRGLLDALIATARRDPDDNARRFGILAIGEMAYRQPSSGDPAGKDEPERLAVERKLERYYRAAFAGRNVQKSDLAWLCLSAALYGHGFPEQASFVSDQLVKIATGGGMKDRQAAAVVGLGILDAKRAVPALKKLFARSKDKLVKGYLAETLGILGDRSQRDVLLKLVRTDGAGEVRYRAALGLAFTADASLIDPLVETLATTASNEVKAALARVVGELGDRKALPALVRIASDTKADVWTRRRALGAIGMIAQESDHAWTTSFQRGVNFPQATPTLRAVLSLF